ncbi:NAD(P)/FAD-dependent oxidoreductase [Kutzneria albida]|uniref:NAD(FAD)-dependent dehydrogenase n=1 Tax=Kutzneria albida DSM 43870 TaxID=1449976 RepID=W5WED0_9PSEU|nr:FAD-dependent oxidoreductase [Kutzneria albida]AHH96534.1 NAD(FAD)-dependent dehydrogenase [Kutzneria albida DSM 43870]
MRTVVVVGASLAGLSAVRALRAQGYDGHLVVVGEERHQPYDRPPLSKDFLAGKATAGSLDLLGDQDEALEVQWRLGTRAVRINAADRSVLLSTEDSLRCDGVVLATGARARALPGGGGLDRVHCLRTLDDAVALRADLLPGARLVIIGAGFIGAEVASTARLLGLDVTVVEADPVPLARQFGLEMGQLCARLHGENGVRLLTGVGVRELVGASKVEGVRLVDGTVLPADVVVVGIGAVPNTEWLAGSGLVLGNGVITDTSCATNLGHVVAVGDCAAVHGERVEHWTNALEQPTVAAATLLDGERGRHVHTAAPYFWSDQYGVRIQFAGHRAPGDAVRVVEGDPEERSFLAVYERAGEPVAVVAMNRAKAFGRWRRQLVRHLPTT